ncbi:mRNA N(3)-methylcytidine methyltransferase METTL8 isoform X1 [Polypterus senegalus]|uniref:mRNA N(3)-methylcytidine methyltransferase METTL8 isoform X1 n=2 Tax=Polypterus senegalus TaxID=55291 RepID=UPI001964A0AC|nr:mRNA N(3)-methylcytidine methyltransferase METTL8 isoform X1 [Polypterus senegalus]XP_039613544.1 mRNA N(3)-methylcytidine methyltransferase METTL8 isoform X1 [Polypterus senegalus]
MRRLQNLLTNSKMKRWVCFPLLRNLTVVKGTKMRCRFESTGRPAVPLGSRLLTDPSKVFEHNMWDHVQWSEKDKEMAEMKSRENSAVLIPHEYQNKFDEEARKYWNDFYIAHESKFFKNRNWLFREFPEILSHKKEMCTREYGECNDISTSSVESNLCHSDGWQSEDSSHFFAQGDNLKVHHTSVINETVCSRESSKKLSEFKEETNVFPGSEATFRIFEVGCGAGNSVFPILHALKDQDSGPFLYCCDFSSRAVELIKSHPDYSPALCHVFVHDVCTEAATYPFPDESLDIILLVFVLSSIHPERMHTVVNRLTRLLKPGGMLLFRDYGRYDLTQLRFKKGHCLSENFYVRGDGTRVYFFTKEEVHDLFANAGLKEIQNLEDRRLQVNRKKQVIMHRVWMQSKYQKPAT